MLLVLAHPDDEILCLGGHLDLLNKGYLVTVTNGAPRDLGEARAHGFPSARAYADARTRELAGALALAGWNAGRLTGLGLPDQGAAFALASLARSLAEILQARRPQVVITHAYEGGHPDHDAVACAVHAARRLIGPERPAFDIMEAPFYRLGEDGGWIRQSFAPHPGEAETALPLGPVRQALKRRMLERHASQAATLSAFDTAVERFRPAPPYDFAELPNGGALLYEGQGWGLDGARWQALVRDAQAALFGAAGA